MVGPLEMHPVLLHPIAGPQQNRIAPLGLSRPHEPGLCGTAQAAKLPPQAQPQPLQAEAWMAQAVQHPQQQYRAVAVPQPARLHQPRCQRCGQLLLTPGADG